MQQDVVNRVEAELREIEEEFASGRMNAFGTAATKENFVRELRKIADIETQVFYKTCGLLSASIAEDHIMRAMMFTAVDQPGMAASSPNNTDECSTTLGTNIPLGREACNKNKTKNNNTNSNSNSNCNENAMKGDSNNNNNTSSGNSNNYGNSQSGNNDNKNTANLATGTGSSKAKPGSNDEKMGGEVGNSLQFCGDAGGEFGSSSLQETGDCALGQKRTAATTTANATEAANCNEAELPPWGHDVGFSDRPFLDVSRHFKMLEGEFAVIGEHLRNVSKYVLRLNDIVEKVRNRGSNLES